MKLKIGVVGAGAIGGFFAVRLVEAGFDVSVLARGENCRVMAEEGLTLTSKTGDKNVSFSKVSDDANALGVMDVIIFTVKGQDTTQASEDMRAMVGPETEIISFQNGLSGVEILLEKFNPEKINPGITYVPAVLEKPGFIRHTGPVTRSVFGPYKPRSMELHNHIAESLQSVGMDVHALPEPLPEVWEKFVVLAPFHLVGCLTRLPLGGWISSPELQDLFLNAMKEVIAVGVKKGVAITPDIAEKQLHFCKNKSDPKTRASMLDDLNRGKRLEMDSTIGWLCREGKRLGVPTPIHETGYALLTPYREGTPEQP